LALSFSGSPRRVAVGTGFSRRRPAAWISPDVEAMAGSPRSSLKRGGPPPFTCMIRGKETTMRDSDSKQFVLAGVVMKRLLSGKQTAGQFCLLENKSGGNTRTPIHVHAKDDETVYIIEGELTALIEGQPRRLTAGDSLFLPRGIPHQLMNMSGNPCRYILIGTPLSSTSFSRKVAGNFDRTRS
jgi:quercetin dioxygenase-like cupin family protein